MKLTNLFWVLPLAAVVAGCNTGDPTSGCRPGEIVNSDGRCELGGATGGTGGAAGAAGAGGEGGGGGAADGACTNDADQAVYAALDYTDADGGENSGSEAASAIASDCVFAEGGTVGPSCTEFANTIIICAITLSCTPQQVADLTNCVGACTQNTIEDITGSTLSAGCADCYSQSVACSAEKCATSGCSNPTSTPCVECRCLEGCTPGFDTCSGLPDSGACDPFL